MCNYIYKGAQFTCGEICVFAYYFWEIVNATEMLRAINTIIAKLRYAMIYCEFVLNTIILYSSFGESLQWWFWTYFMWICEGFLERDYQSQFKIFFRKGAKNLLHGVFSIFKFVFFAKKCYFVVAKRFFWKFTNFVVVYDNENRYALILVKASWSSENFRPLW